MYYRYHDMKRKGRATKEEKRGVSRPSPDHQQQGNPPIPSCITFPAVKRERADHAGDVTYKKSDPSTNTKAHMDSLQNSLQRMHVAKKRKKRQQVAPTESKAKLDDEDEKRNTWQGGQKPSQELIFDEDPVVNKILSDLYRDFLNEASTNGDLNALSSDDKLLLESASSAAFDVNNEDELDEIIKSM